MAGKPPTAVKAPAKATFKHNLPNSVGATYFSTLTSYVQTYPDYNTEHEKVCYDILRACQMASLGFPTETTGLGAATTILATGKPLYHPQRDLYNGPLQAFLQHPLSALGRPQVWQHWVKSRDTLVEDFSLFAKRAFRSETRVIDPPEVNMEAGSPLRRGSFHGGNMAGSFTGSFAGKSPRGARSPRGGSREGSQELNSTHPAPSTSQRKLMMRPGTAQAPVREAQGTDILIRCGLNSFFDPERLVLVHIWANPRAARTFVQSWRRLAQVTFEHRLDMIHCPISVVNCIESTFVSVTALPPILDTNTVPPLRGVGKAEDDSDSFESLIQRMSRQLLQVLSSDTQDSAASQGGLTLYPGLDGRYYLMNLHMPYHPKFTSKALSSTVLPRPELVYTMIQEKKLDKTLDQVLVEVALPRALRVLHDMLEDPSFTVDVVVRDGLCPMTFHQFGVNLKLLGKALLMVESGELNLPSQKATILLRTMLLTELVGRTLKHLIRLDCHAGAAGSQQERDISRACNNTKARLSVVNRLARLAVAKDQVFLDEQLLPSLRTKFNLPPTFVMKWTEIAPGTCLKILSSKLGCEFGSAEGRFHKFVDSSSKDLVMLACNAPLEAVLCEDKPAGEMATNIFWTQCLSIPSDSTLYESYLLRACAMSVITGAHLGRIPLQLVDGSAQAEANAMAPVFLLQLAGVLFEHMCKHTKAATAAQRFLAALKRHMIEVDSRRESSATITPEATYNSLKQIAAAPLVEKYLLNAKDGDLSPARGANSAVDPTYLEDGIKFFVDQPHVDFVYSSLHSQALRDLEAMIPLMNREQLDHFLSETVESVVSNLQRAGRLNNAARYISRVAVQLTNITLAEKSLAAANTMRTTYSLSMKAYGIEDPRTSVALYLQCLFALSVAQNPTHPTSVGNTITQCRKIYQKAMTLQPEDQKLLYRTATVFGVLQRVQTSLEIVCDVTTKTTLNSHIKLLTSLHAPVIMFQMVGRGFLVRKHSKSVKELEKVPQPNPKLASLGITPGVGPINGSFVRAGSGQGSGLLTPSNSGIAFGNSSLVSPPNSGVSIPFGNSSTSSLPGRPPALATGGSLLSPPRSPGNGTRPGRGVMAGGLGGSPDGPQAGSISPFLNNSGGSFVLPKHPPPLPPALVTVTDPNGSTTPQSGTLKMDELQSQQSETSSRGARDTQEEMVVENLDSPTSSIDEEEKKPAVQSLLGRKPTFTRGSPNPGSPAGLTRKGTFNTPPGAAAGNNEFSMSSAQSSGMFSPQNTRTGPRRRLDGGSVNLASSMGLGASMNASGMAGSWNAENVDVDFDDEEDNNESIFNNCDKDHDGLVSVDDCVDVFSKLSSSKSRAELHSLFSQAVRTAKTGGGKMNKQEFLRFVARAGL